MQISLVHRDMDEFDASAFSTAEEKEMLHSISKLNLSHNFLVHIRGVHSLSNLTELDISHNKITTLAMIPLKLRRLHASYNNLAKLDGLTPLTQLEYCDVSYNEIKSLQVPGTFPNTLAMRHLDVSHNRLTSLEGVDAIPGLHVLHANHNLIREVEFCLDPVLRNLKSLRSLSLNENPVTARGKNVDVIQALIPKLGLLDGVPVPSQPNPNQGRSSSANTSANQSALSNMSTARPSSRDRSAGGPAHNNSTSNRLGAGGETSTSMNPTATTRKAASPGKSRAVARSPKSSPLSATSLPRPESPRDDMPPSLQQRPSSASRTRSSAAPAPTARNGASQPREVSPSNNTTADSSVNSLAAQRRMQQRIDELERTVQDYAGRYKNVVKENETLRMQLEQLKDTVTRQGKVNAMLASQQTQEEVKQRHRDTTSASAVPAPRVGWTGHKETQRAVPSSGLKPAPHGTRVAASTTTAQKRPSSADGGSRSGSAPRQQAGGSTRAAAPVTASPKNQDQMTRPVRSTGGAPSTHVKQQQQQQVAANQNRNGSTQHGQNGSGGGVRPSSATRSKPQATTPGGNNGYSARTPQSIIRTPATAGSSASRRPQSADARLKSILAELAHDSSSRMAGGHNGSVASSRSGRNVSFGGSQFYSPPQRH